MPLFGAGCKLDRCEPVEAGMGPLRIVVDPPCLDDPAGVFQAGEQMLVEALVPQPPVEALHEAVLHRLAGLDVMPFDAAFLLPYEHGVRGQLRAVQLPSVRHFHAAILRAPLVKRRVAVPMPSAQISRRHPGLMLLQDPNNLLFRKPAALHRPSPSNR